MHKNNRGFSLVEIVIAAGILGFVTLATTTLMTMIAQTGGKARFENDVVNDLDRLRALLNKEHICTANLKGKSLTPILSNPFKIVEVKKDASGNYIKDTKNLSDLDADVRLQLDPSSKLAILKFKFESKTKITGPNEVYRDMFLYANVDASNKITDCSVVGKIKLSNCYSMAAMTGPLSCASDEVATKFCVRSKTPQHADGWAAGANSECPVPPNSSLYDKGRKVNSNWQSSGDYHVSTLTCCKLE